MTLKSNTIKAKINYSIIGGELWDMKVAKEEK